MAPRVSRWGSSFELFVATFRTRPREALVSVSLRTFARRVAAGAVCALVLGVFALTPARAAGGIGDLLVTSDAANATAAYDGISGAALGVVATSVVGHRDLGVH